MCLFARVLLDSRKEKAVRSDMKSDIHRRLDTRNLLIFDGSNYIKGYRYEIYCMTKLCKTPQCTVYCDIPVEHAWLWNDKRAESERYSREIFDELVARYLSMLLSITYRIYELFLSIRKKVINLPMISLDKRLNI